MRTFCTRHTYRGTSRAWRLVLAHHSLDRDARRHIVDEIDSCAQCWQDTALALADAAHVLLIRCGPLPEMDSRGVVTGPVIDGLYERIESALECEQRDRRDLDE